jgi:hypothetical protein
MIKDNKQKKVVQVSAWVHPDVKKQIEELANKDGRSVSNYCKNKLLGAIKV